MSRHAPIDCRLETSTRDARVEQIQTGLALLHAAGRIRLRQRVYRTNRYDTSPPDGPVGRNDAVHPGFVRLLVGGRRLLHFDLGDGPAIDPIALGECDLYFKRSFHPETVAALGADGERVRPLGLNFPVFPDRADRFALGRILQLSRWRELPAELVRWADTGNRISFLARRRHFEGPPNLASEPKVLFLARAWDPHDDSARPPEKVAEFEEVNETRAECIRALRREFGQRFLGGLSRSAFALRRYPDVVVPESFDTSKRSYFRLLHDYPVCVATTGLHGSIGWKFGEYVALGKAIVSEPLRYLVPGPLEAGRHYLEFEGSDACIDAVARILDDTHLRQWMMKSNLGYFDDFGSPEALAWRAIAKGN